MLPLQAQKQNWQLAQQMPLLQLSAAKHVAAHNYAVHLAAQSWKVVFLPSAKHIAAHNYERDDRRGNVLSVLRMKEWR